MVAIASADMPATPLRAPRETQPPNTSRRRRLARTLAGSPQGCRKRLTAAGEELTPGRRQTVGSVRAMRGEDDPDAPCPRRAFSSPAASNRGRSILLPRGGMSRSPPGHTCEALRSAPAHFSRRRAGASPFYVVGDHRARGSSVRGGSAARHSSSAPNAGRRKLLKTRRGSPVFPPPPPPPPPPSIFCVARGSFGSLIGGHARLARRGTAPVSATGWKHWPAGCHARARRSRTVRWSEPECGLVPVYAKPGAQRSARVVPRGRTAGSASRPAGRRAWRSRLLGSPGHAEFPKRGGDCPLETHAARAPAKATGVRDLDPMHLLRAPGPNREGAERRSGL
jgi:hypothetical protein